MSLRPHPIAPVPEETARVARAAFPKGTPYLTLRNALGTIFQDDDFADLYSREGQPGLAPWQLALVTLMQFRENLADRQAAEAVRGRIDWKYLLGLELTAPGFHFCVLSEFRERLVSGEVTERLLDTLLTRCRELGMRKGRGQQRTDATHVLAAIRVLNRLELLGETLRATLNDLATAAPEWLQGIVPLAWYERYGKRIEDTRLPQADADREAYAQQVGEDGFTLLEALDTAPGSPELRAHASVATLRRLWSQHFERQRDASVTSSGRAMPRVRLKAPRELPRAADNLESPYDVDARYSRKRGAPWTGYTVHLSETCDPPEVHLITHVHTTPATVHEAMCTAAIQQALVDKDCAPQEHLVDAAYIDAALLVSSQQEQGITLLGPPRPNSSWQAQVPGAYTIEQFQIDWDRQQVTCPQGKVSATWTPQVDHTGSPSISVKFRQQDCAACGARASCTRAKTMPRHLHFRPREQWEALATMRAQLSSEAGKAHYKRRAGIEGTLSQGVRAFGLRRTRYRGAPKTHLQHVAIAGAINIERLVAWFEERPRAQTRASRFAALAPEYVLVPDDAPR